jgi:cysteine desulfurase/selenocysteine lyase
MPTPTNTGEIPAPAAPAAPESAPQGLPDIETLTRWANEWFAAAPSRSDAAAGGASAPVPGAGTDLSKVELPAGGFGESWLPRLEAADLIHPSVPSVPISSSGAPASGGLPRQGDFPSFYFLDAHSAPIGKAAGHPPFDVHAIRRDFPILATRVHGRPLVWFDNAATTQKPQAVIERLSTFYRTENSNIHRAAHELAARATDAYENARRQLQQFLGAASPEEIVFVRGATEAINLVAQSWGSKNIAEGDEIVISHLEHHANIVPWKVLADEQGAKLRVIPVDSSGQIRLDEYQRLLSPRTKIVSIAQVSNALGTITPVEEVVELAHRAGALALVDGAQSVSHMPVDVNRLDADFFVLSGHKLFGPTGIGVLYGRRSVLEGMPPWQGGGNMIEDVTFEGIRYQGVPARFEAGTGNIADAAGLGAAVEYLNGLGMSNIEHYEAGLLAYATERLSAVPRLKLIGTAPKKASVLSFIIEGLDPVAIGSALNQEGIAVRAGHHCAQPILRRFGYEATVRASLALYNTCEEVDALAAALRRLAASPLQAYR